MGMTTMQRYIRLCSIFTGVESSAGRSEFLQRISVELADGAIPLDNCLYEHLGLSGEELLEVLERGEMLESTLNI